MDGTTLEFLAFFAAEIAALHLLFRWLERRWPPRPRADVSHVPAEPLARMARRADRLGTALCLAAWPAAFAAWGLGFAWLQPRMVPDVPGGLFLRTPTPAVHILPALFASIALAGPIGLGLMRGIYGRRFAEVIALGDRHFRLDIRSWMYATFVWVVPLCVDAESLVLGRYVIFAPDGIHSRAPWSRREALHPYHQVESLLAVDGLRTVSGQVLPDRRFVIRFRDGAEVPSPRFLYHGGPEDFAPLLYASRRSGVPVARVPDFD